MSGTFSLFHIFTFAPKSLRDSQTAHNDKLHSIGTPGSLKSASDRPYPADVLKSGTFVLSNSISSKIRTYGKTIAEIDKHRKQIIPEQEPIRVTMRETSGNSQNSRVSE